ncbi:hypothetical protein ACFL51_00975 [Myxococcota bacterium]
MKTNPYETEERCCVCGHPLGGPGAQKGLCDCCMKKFREESLAPAGLRCPLCGERRRRNLVRHTRSGEFLCYSCRDAVDALPVSRQNIEALRGAFARRFGPS